MTTIGHSFSTCGFVQSCAVRTSISVAGKVHTSLRQGSFHRSATKHSVARATDGKLLLTPREPVVEYMPTNVGKVINIQQSINTIKSENSGKARESNT